MKTTPEHDRRMAAMKFSEVYPHYVAKVEKKGRTKEELHQVITWLTGFDENRLTQQVRYLDKLVDELAKGKSMDKILRK
ncbi:MAG: DUF2200 family protein [Spirochaeta sp.]